MSTASAGASKQRPSRQRASTAIAVTPGPGAPGVLARAQWPDGPDDVLPPIAGFILSSFSPLVAEVAERCLRARYGGPPPADAERGGGTGVVLASVLGDVGTAEALAGAVREGRRVPPLLFFQSNPNAVVGHLTARWGLGGPVVCTSPTGDALSDGLAVAALLLEGGDAAEVLVIAAEQAAAGGGKDRAEAVVLGRPAMALQALPTHTVDQVNQVAQFTQRDQYSQTDPAAVTERHRR